MCERVFVIAVFISLAVPSVAVEIVAVDASAQFEQVLTKKQQADADVRVVTAASAVDVAVETEKKAFVSKADNEQQDGEAKEKNMADAKKNEEKEAEMASAEGGPTYGSAMVAEDGSILVGDMVLVRSKLKRTDTYSPQQESAPEALAEQIESSLPLRSTVVTSDGEAVPLQTEGSAEVSMAIEKQDDKKAHADTSGSGSEVGSSSRGSDDSIGMQLAPALAPERNSIVAEYIVELAHKNQRAAVAEHYGEDTILHHLRLPSLQGFVVHATKAVADAMRKDARIKKVDRSAPISLVIDNPDQPPDRSAAPRKGKPKKKVSSGPSLRNWTALSHSKGKPWNLDRVNGKNEGKGNEGLDGNDSTKNDGQGVSIFVLDTGIDCEHDEFDGGRCENVGSFSTGAKKAGFSKESTWRDKKDKDWGSGWQDKPEKKEKENNDEVKAHHGTHVAATAAGKDYGIAPKAKIYGMKVLHGSGRGTMGDILHALNSIYELVSCDKDEGGLCKLKNEPILVLMSLGGRCIDPKDHEECESSAAAKKCYDEAPTSDEETCAFKTRYAEVIRNFRQLGILTVVAAGNNNEDACTFEPAAARDAVTVGAIKRGDRRWFHSNYGKCVDIMAPGADIASAAPDGITVSNAPFLDEGSEQHTVLSGTSQAAPLVAGILALYMNVIGNNRDAEGALNAMLNNAEHIDTGAGNFCPSNGLLAKTPGTKKKSDLNMKPGKEHPCKLIGEEGGKKPDGPRPRPRPRNQRRRRDGTRPRPRPRNRRRRGKEN